jgi:hypothetical protein
MAQGHKCKFDFYWFSLWLTPPVPPKRLATADEPCAFSLYSSFEDRHDLRFKLHRQAFVLNGIF